MGAASFVLWRGGVGVVGGGVVRHDLADDESTLDPVAVDDTLEATPGIDFVRTRGAGAGAITQWRVAPAPDATSPVRTDPTDSLLAAGFDIRSQIIWAKDRLVLSRGDYHWQHEPCWYAVKKRGKGHWAGDRKQTTLWQIANRDQDAETVHGTQKPVECMRRPILNNSSPGQAIYEPFMGSGTTLIAAETTGRVCYGIELNPAYVDVAITRWQNLTGQTAVLDGTDQTFEALTTSRR